MRHATKLFPIALDRLLEIGEKARKQRVLGVLHCPVNRGHACMQCMRRNKQNNYNYNLNNYEQNITKY